MDQTGAILVHAPRAFQYSVVPRQEIINTLQ